MNRGERIGDNRRDWDGVVMILLTHVSLWKEASGCETSEEIRTFASANAWAADWW